MGRSPELRESSSRHSPSSATATWSSPEFFFPHDIYISDPTLLFRETQWHGVRACDPFCALLGCDKWGVCSFVSSAGRSTNRVQVGCGRIIASLFLLIYLFIYFALTVQGNAKPDFVLSVECCPRPARRPPRVFTGLHRSG